MAIKKVWIEPGCIRCYRAADLCPEVFEMQDDGNAVRPGADLDRYEAKIRDAASGCPVEVIKFSEG